MAYYDALIAKWATLSGTTEERLAAVNTATTAGPKQDIRIGDVLGILSLRGVLTAMEDWLEANPTPSAIRSAAKELLRLIASPHVSVFQTSDPDTYLAIQGMLQGFVSVSAFGLSSADADLLIALADGPPVPWGAANGYPAGGINVNDLAAAGLI